VCPGLFAARGTGLVPLLKERFPQAAWVPLILRISRSGSSDGNVNRQDPEKQSTEEPSRRPRAEKALSSTKWADEASNRVFILAMHDARSASSPRS
jgi:hypothetical protein